MTGSPPPTGAPPPGAPHVVGFAGVVDLDTAAADDVVLWADDAALEALGAPRTAAS